MGVCNYSDQRRRTQAARSRRSGGFSMLELILVLSVVGLLAGIALSQVNTEPYSAAGEAGELKRALRYAQSLAFAQAYLPDTTPPTAQETWGLEFSNNSYKLVRGNNTSQTDVNLPGESSPTYNLPSGASINAGTIGTLYFNFRGMPSDQSGTALTSDTTITVSTAHESSTLTVTQETGFIP